MAWRGPRRGLKQPPSQPDEEDPTAVAELYLVKIPTDGGEQVIHDPKPARWYTSLLRRTGVGAAARLAVPARDASQMLAVIERVIITLGWAATVVVTLMIAVTWPLSATATITVIALELAGLIIALLATRKRRKRTLDARFSQRRKPGPHPP